MAHSTFIFTSAGREKFHAFLSENVRNFDVAFERIQRGQELAALEAFENQRSGETLNYEVRGSASSTNNPVCFNPTEADVQEITHDEDEA